MLLDDDDLRMIKNKNERVLFNEVLNTYYSNNYRGAIVSLYSGLAIVPVEQATL